MGQSGRPLYPGGLATPTSLGNVGSNSHSSADLRVGTAVALASSVAKYWVLTNLFPGPIPQVSVYHHPHHRGGAGGGETQTTKDSATLLNQDMSLTSGTHQQTPNSHHHQSSVNRNTQHSSLQSTAQVCLSSVCMLYD